MEQVVFSANDAYDAWRILSEADQAAAKILAKRDGKTWERCLAIGRAVAYVHGFTRDKRERGNLIARYPNLKEIPSPSRSDAKCVWEHREMFEAAAREGRITLGHPTSVRQAWRDLKRVKPSTEPDLRGLVSEFVRRSHNDTSRIVEAMIALAALGSATAAERILRKVLASN